MVSGGTRLKPQEDSLNMPVDMVVGTPGRILDHIKEGNIVYGDIKYLVCSWIMYNITILQNISAGLNSHVEWVNLSALQILDEADTMFDQGFGEDIRKFLAPLKNRASKPGDQGFQTVLVSATMTKVLF
jgi:superfamily II DNA/RNA helicase